MNSFWSYSYLNCRRVLSFVNEKLCEEKIKNCGIESATVCRVDGEENKQKLHKLISLPFLLRFLHNAIINL